jgi:hypothetical protein
MHTPPVSSPSDTQTRLLLVSTRGMRNDVSRCLTYEFEDAVIATENALLLAPGLVDRSQTFLNKVLKTLGPWTGTDLRLRPTPVAHVEVSKSNFELTLVVIQSIRDLYDLEKVEGWSNAAPKSFCLIEEVWVNNISRKDAALLEQFDHIILNCRHAVEPLRARIDVPVTYLPPSVDMHRFCPQDINRARPIDAFSMGRRSAKDHQHLLERCRNNQDFFYLYDSVRFASAIDPLQHRELLANAIQRTKWFPVNRAKIDDPTVSSHQEEVGFRYFEGAAAGAVMIGEKPNSPTFEENLGWTDSVLVSSEGESILDVIDMLEADPVRVAQIRRRNVAHSLRRHDPSYRYRTILGLAELTPTPQLKYRIEMLHTRADALDRSMPLPI